ncbi:prepilin-type N-terminal cleavage/methylation domain-containing protein [Kamptonema sp. UHCC 0994]|uniref:prepilin-type N-terminal cleavage/methylation domain-containing protein n=1 Tax=Kamptonema sp. UHCC 0994 TaxID=3031329 RepID=UPI0023B9571D|nr:prepilin-type N-terminal cleavage/methylation domain-containing protein [Kamptonema sp. UHCC 0994]MDF0555814.1 prepilin-type N-terminal cleavage/methylation domain-containing protein [Kamptonema sp. UHCC 0994]
MKNPTLLKLWQTSLAASSKPHLQQLSGLSSQSRIGLGKKHQQHDTGFTLIELLILLLIIGILSSIAAPGWLAFINNQRLRTSQSRVYGALQLAQSNAKRDKVAWQATFRTQGNLVQWAVHPATTDPTSLPVSTSPSSAPNVWYSLEDKISISTTGTGATNLLPGSGTYIAIFNRQGCLVDDKEKECTDAVTAFTIPQRITLEHSQLGTARKCAVVTTLLGAIKTADDEASCALNP